MLHLGITIRLHNERGRQHMSARDVAMASAVDSRIANENRHDFSFIMKREQYGIQRLL